eukprot:TRINITY_DN7040_c0_g1_i2.p4 TRINITY_DN7040_c0_g1~~TRINITY_DN7040_c0_g1_i2.p4  ORF type:complete len:136 (+),score=12.18 TRINITY_DN7040_c0_g1_i2:71-478(+)
MSVYDDVFFFSSRRRHTRFLPVSWARRCVQETVILLLKYITFLKDTNQQKYIELIIIQLISSFSISKQPSMRIRKLSQVLIYRVECELILSKLADILLFKNIVISFILICFYLDLNLGNFFERTLQRIGPLAFTV